MLAKILKLLNGGKAEAQDVPSAPGFEASDQLIAEGNRAEEAGDFPVACEHYRRAVAAAPRYAKAHLNLAIGLEAIGNAAEARRSYEAALAIDPGDVLANYNFGRQLFLGNSQDRAEQLLRRAIDGNPDFPDARIVLAQVLENKGDLNAAATELEMALRLADMTGFSRLMGDIVELVKRLNKITPEMYRDSQGTGEAAAYWNDANMGLDCAAESIAALADFYRGKAKMEEEGPFRRMLFERETEYFNANGDRIAVATERLMQQAHGRKAGT